MAKDIEDEKDIEIPGDEDENVGEDVPKKKKRRKSKEERIAERKVIFWTLLIVILITVGFWLVPKVGSMFRGEEPVQTENKSVKPETSPQKNESKNYVEITL